MASIPSKFTSATLVIAIAGCITGCTTMPAGQSGFLSTYAVQKPDADDKASHCRAASAALVDPSPVRLGEVEWRAQGVAKITVEDQEHLVTHLRGALEQQMHALPTAPGGRSVVVRAAITRVVTVSPALNALSTVALFVPLDRGGAAVEIEALDSETHRQLAVLKRGYYAPPWNLVAQFSRLGPAEFAIRKASVEFASRLHSDAACRAIP
jgi:hypothetical protein